jgi:hypothetical protein
MLVPAETCANDEGPGADPNAIAPNPEPALSQLLTGTGRRLWPVGAVFSTTSTGA